MSGQLFEMTQSAGSRRRERLFEMLAFLSLIVPSMCLSFLMVRQVSLGFVVTAVATISRDLGLATLIAFFLWRNAETKDRIGLHLHGGLKNVILGAALFVVVLLASLYLEQWLHAAGFSTRSAPTPAFLTARGSAEFVLAILLVGVVALTEEIIFRGYLILRLKTVTGSSVLAVALSSVIFCLGHGYEGTAGVVTVGFTGLAYALVYVWTESLTAPIVMHFLQDIVGIVVLPILRHK
jgi:membrane protease YdiL (CAAX protease family)